jgi:hypothetical protein
MLRAPRAARTIGPELRENVVMVGPLLFAVYVASFVAILYAGEHLVSTRWSVLRSNERDAAPRDRD